MITSFHILIITAFLSLVAAAEPVGICLHAYSPEAPAEKIECFEFEKFEQVGDDYRFFPHSNRSVKVTAYRFRGIVPYRPNLAATHPDFDELLKLYEETARVTPSTRAFLNHRILAMRAQKTTGNQGISETADDNSPEEGITIETPEGKTLNDCQAISIHNEEVSLMHSGGVMRVRIDALSEREKELLDYDSLVEKHQKKMQINAEEEEKLKKLRAMALAREKERKEMAYRIENLARLAGGLRSFRVQRVLDVSDFPDLRLLLSSYEGVYEIVINGSLAILVTTKTTFKSNGNAVLNLYWSDTCDVELTNGFKKEIKVFTESDAAAVAKKNRELEKKQEEYRRKFPD